MNRCVWLGKIETWRPAAANNSIDLMFGWDPSEQVATRPLILQKYGQYNLFYTHDGNKNVSELVFFQQANGIAAHYEYAPFGAVTATSRSTPVTAYDFRECNPFRFSAEYADDVLCLVHYNFRHYEPCVGRWLNRDPIGEDGGHNLMSFAINNPATRFDTDGCFVLPIMVIPDPTPPPPPEPSPSITDHFGNSTDPLGEERWFENNYAGWLAEARRRFTAEINSGVDCSSTTFNGPSGRINIYPSDDRGGSTSKQTPGGNEQEYGDAGQSDWSADKVLGSFSIDYVTPVTITYTNGTNGKCAYTWTTTMYVEDVLGTQEGDRIRIIPGVASITPSRRVRRASWTLSGSGECCVKK